MFPGTWFPCPSGSERQPACWGAGPLFHLHVIPAINPSDKLELSPIDMFTREVHI